MFLIFSPFVFTKQLKTKIAHKWKRLSHFTNIFVLFFIKTYITNDGIIFIKDEKKKKRTPFESILFHFLQQKNNINFLLKKISLDVIWNGWNVLTTWSKFKKIGAGVSFMLRIHLEPRSRQLFFVENDVSFTR